MSTINIEFAETVLCDLCNTDYSDSNKSGGFIFQSKGVCPDCAEQFLENVKKYNEEDFIRSFCPRTVSFKEYIIKERMTDFSILCSYLPVRLY